MLFADLIENFNEAAESGDATKEFEALKSAYKEFFGEKYDAFMHIMFNHNGANMHDYLHADHVSRFPAMEEVSRSLRTNAINTLIFEWGSEEQVSAENKAFELAISSNIFSQSEAEFHCFKATTEEMMDWIESQCAKHIEKGG